MDFEGTVFKIMPATSGTSARGPWERQEVIFEQKTQSQFPRRVAVTFFNKADEVNRLHEGVTYVVSFDLESREFNGRWYTDVRAWKIEKGDAAMQAPYAAQPAVAAQPYATPAQIYATPTPDPVVPQFNAEPSATDDLPF